jgi:trans-o-hydroxybenzylidenepyruvate hydratase-aldolase
LRTQFGKLSFNHNNYISSPHINNANLIARRSRVIQKQRKLMTAADVKGVWAIIPAPAKPGADHWDAKDTVDLDEASRAVEDLIQGGVDAILTLGTLGEVATLTWSERQAYMRAVIDTAAGRVPIFVGTSTLNTRDTVEQTRWAAKIGAVGSMIGPPMWCAPSLPTAVQFYRDVAEACPDMAICVYANPDVFKFDFPMPFWAQVSTIPQVITAKLPPMPQMLALASITGGRISFLSMDNEYYAAARLDPEAFRAFWSSSASCGPEVAYALRDRVAEAVAGGDWAPAKHLSDAMGAAIAPLFPPGGFKEFSSYNIALEKERMNAAGWINAGPTRAPYSLVPAPYLENARKSGSAWAKLNEDVKAGLI